jgi:Tfp pilus assembly protein PilZ
MHVVHKKSSLDKRINPRRSFSGNIFFITKTGLNEGRLKNFSRYGLFIETSESVSVGEIITIALPYLNGKDIKCKGQIMWRNSEGCGVELFRKRRNTNFRIIK